MLDATDEFFVLQKHQVNVEQGCELMRRLFGPHEGHAFLQTVNFINNGVATHPNPVNLGRHLRGLDEIVRHIHAAGSNQHRTPDGDAPGDSQTVDGERQITLPRRTYR